MKYKKTAFIFVSKLCRKFWSKKNKTKKAFILVYDRDMYSSKTKED